MLREFDIFGRPVQSFNLGGRQVLKTWMGSIASAIIFSVVLLYSLLKLQYLMERKNPLITTNV